MPSPDAQTAGGGARRTLSAVIGGLLAVALMVWALRGVHFAEVVHHLRNAHLVPLVGAVVLATLTYPVRLIRWRLLLRDAAGGPLPALPLWHAVAIGFMANKILPFRAGELVRL
ncbi:MAG TPA: lysylphosphatidylglycerol synthase domain-containing protein, partial [Gemmatimonadales bacterium]|nr:lysylphosphatidylglycerol synthase domain-containing protein [Gemmatimonadales bacterium]